MCSPLWSILQGEVFVEAYGKNKTWTEVTAYR